MTSMVDYFPTLRTGGKRCLGVSKAQTCLPSGAIRQKTTRLYHELFKWFDWFQDGAEWRGVRTQQYTYAEWLSGKKELYDLADPLQMHNLAGQAGALETRLQTCCVTISGSVRMNWFRSDWAHWLDEPAWCAYPRT